MRVPSVGAGWDCGAMRRWMLVAGDDSLGLHGELAGRLVGCSSQG